MEITINDKTYTLRFGVGFVRKLNLAAGISIDMAGVKTSMGFGLQKTLPALNAGDPSALSDALWAAAQNKANSIKPKQDIIDDYLDTDADIEKLTADVIAEIKASNTTKDAAKNMLA